jgi:GTP-binding protein
LTETPPTVKIDRIEFTCSSPSLKICPKEEIPEFAFIGRSNVGKSSLINMLAGRKALAKVSGTPGKTRMINHFRVSSSVERIAAPFDWFLVDLPGYGFAKLSKSEREKFEGIIRTYLEKRDNLALTFLLVDARHEPQRIDLEFMDWLGDHDVAFVILFTKCDKLSKTTLQTNLAAYAKALSETWNELPAMVTTSSETKQGREELLGIIGEALREICG